LDLTRQRAVKTDCSTNKITRAEGLWFVLAIRVFDVHLAAMLDSILYVSESRLRRQSDQDQLAHIQYVSVSRNSLHDITGVLISTPDHFAQFIEGNVRDLDAVMTSIRADPRHTGIVMAETSPSRVRLFPTWRMARFGPGAFVDDHVRPLVERRRGRLTPSGAREMITLMRRMVADFRVRPPWL
jgi:Sensors of blue-light using FAD